MSFVQKGDSLYLYFPGGIGQDTYADPGYFSLGVTLGEVIDEIRVPGTPGYYVPGTDDWVFPIHMVESTADMNGAITTYGDTIRVPGPMRGNRKTLPRYRSSWPICVQQPAWRAIAWWAKAVIPPGAT